MNEDEPTAPVCDVHFGRGYTLADLYAEQGDPPSQADLDAAWVEDMYRVHGGEA